MAGLLPSYPGIVCVSLLCALRYRPESYNTTGLARRAKTRAQVSPAGPPPTMRRSVVRGHISRLRGAIAVTRVSTSTSSPAQEDISYSPDASDTGSSSEHSGGPLLPRTILSVSSQPSELGQSSHRLAPRAQTSLHPCGFADAAGGRTLSALLLFRSTTSQCQMRRAATCGETKKHISASHGS